MYQDKTRSLRQFMSEIEPLAGDVSPASKSTDWLHGFMDQLKVCYVFSLFVTLCINLHYVGLPRLKFNFVFCCYVLSIEKCSCLIKLSDLTFDCDLDLQFLWNIESVHIIQYFFCLILNHLTFKIEINWMTEHLNSKN